MFIKNNSRDTEERNPLDTKKEAPNKTISCIFKIWNANVRAEDFSVTTIQFSTFFLLEMLILVLCKFFREDYLRPYHC